MRCSWDGTLNKHDMRRIVWTTPQIVYRDHQVSSGWLIDHDQHQWRWQRNTRDCMTMVASSLHHAHDTMSPAANCMTKFLILIAICCCTWTWYIYITFYTVFRVFENCTSTREISTKIHNWKDTYIKILLKSIILLLITYYYLDPD